MKLILAKYNYDDKQLSFQAILCLDEICPVFEMLPPPGIVDLFIKILTLRLQTRLQLYWRLCGKRFNGVRVVVMMEYGITIVKWIPIKSSRVIIEMHLGHLFTHMGEQNILRRSRSCGGHLIYILCPMYITLVSINK